MADIDVMFATNAGTTASQIDRAAASTTKAAAAAKGHTSATNQEAVALKRAAVAAKEKALADTQSAQAATRSAAAQRATLGKGAAFLGAGRAFGGAQAVMGAGAGIGSLVAATAAMTGVGFAIGALTTIVGSWLSSSKESAERMAELSKTLSDVKDRNAQMGIGAAEKLGPNMTALNSIGGNARDLASEFGRDFGFADASKAVLLAIKQFPNDIELALKEANDASRITGLSLSESMAALKGMPSSSLGQGLAAGGAVGQFFGSAQSMDQVRAMRDRSDNDPESLDIRRLMKVGGRMDEFAIDNISGGVQMAIKNMVDSTTAQVDAQNELNAAIRENTRAQEAAAKWFKSFSDFQRSYNGGGSP